MIESIKNIKGFSLSNIKVYYKNKVIKTVYIGKDRPKDYQNRRKIPENKPENLFRTEQY